MSSSLSTDTGESPLATSPLPIEASNADEIPRVFWTSPSLFMPLTTLPGPAETTTSTPADYWENRGSLFKKDLSEQARTVIENAFVYYPRSTPSQRDFLVSCLGIEKERMKFWMKELDLAGRGRLSMRPRRPLKNQELRYWTWKVIERGATHQEGLPSSDQCQFLAAGLRLNPVLLQGIFQGIARAKQYLQSLSPGEKPRSEATASDHPLPIQAITDNQVTIPATEPRPSGTLASQQPPPQESGPRPNGSSDDGDTPATPMIDPEINDEEDEHTLEEHVAAILGPDYAHIAPALARMCPDIPEELPSSPGDSVAESPVGACCSPACSSRTSDASGGSSNSSSTPFGRTPPSSFADSSRSGGSRKRKSPGDGDGDVGGDDKRGGGDGGGDRPPKRAKKTQLRSRLRFDCPIARRAMRMGTDVTSASSRACAPGGLEFRNVWDHMTKAHFGCEGCDKKLNSQSEAMSHLLEKDGNPEACQPCTTDRRHEIGIALWMKLEQIYKDKNLDHNKKWIGWWDLLCPGSHAPDPLHYDTISLSTADIPRVQEMVETMWGNTPSLPVLTTEGKGQVADILDKVLRILPRVNRPRRQKRQPQLQEHQDQAQEAQEEQQQAEILKQGQERQGQPQPQPGAAAMVMAGDEQQCQPPGEPEPPEQVGFEELLKYGWPPPLESLTEDTLYSSDYMLQ